MVYRDPVRLSALFFFGLGVAIAQYPGGYPGGGYPGGYPPGGYPGGGYPGGVGLPIPGRNKQPKNAKTVENAPMPNFRGKLKHMDDKSITLEMDDNRVLDFKRTDKTKFFKGGDEIKSPKFNAGDQISVEGPEDQAGYMTAVNVYWEKGAETSASDKKDDGVTDTWKDAPKDAPKDAANKPAENTPPVAQAAPDNDPDRPVLRRSKSDDDKGDSTSSSASDKKDAPAGQAAPAPPAAQAASDNDPDRPVLRRGKPADEAQLHSAPLPPDAAEHRTPIQVSDATDAPAAPAPALADAAGGRPTQPGMAVPRDEDPRIYRPHSDDPLIRKAADAALDFTETLPNYVVQEMMSRYQSESHPVSWQPLDVVSTNLIYENGKEHYKDVAIDGKKTNKPLEEIGGSWSTGEFGTVLIDLFSPSTAADFRYARESRTSGVSSKVYDFNVTREHSHWTIHVASQSYDPAYRGSVWIDPQTSRVLRIEMQAYGFPDDFPTDHVESAVDYQYIRLGDAKQYLLPVHSESLSCQRGSNICSRNAIDFRNYHKYAGESTVTFESPK